jgi:hypothetical protein
MSNNLDSFLLRTYQSNFNMEELDVFSKEEVFVQTQNSPSSSMLGSQLAKPGESVTIPLTKIAQGDFVVFYANSTDPKLTGPFAGLQLAEAFEIIFALTDADGLILQSSKEAALIIEKKDFKIKHRMR